MTNTETIAIIDLIDEHNNILINESDILNQKITTFNTKIISEHDTLVTIQDYIDMLRNSIYPDINLNHMLYFLQLHLKPTYINSDDLGPQKFGVLSIKSNRKRIDSKDIQTLLDQYEFTENKDYFKRRDVPALGSKTPRTIYVISPYVLKTCLTGSKKIGRTYRKYYFFLETTIYNYNDYQKLFALEDKKSTIKRLEESNARLEASNLRIENKLEHVGDNLDILLDLHEEIHISDNIVTPTDDAELHTQFAIFKSRTPEAVVVDRQLKAAIVYTIYRTQKVRLDKEYKRLCINKATHTLILRIDVHSSVYAWINIKKDTNIKSLIKIVGVNKFINITSDDELINAFTNIAQENKLNVINTLEDIKD